MPQPSFAFVKKMSATKKCLLTRKNFRTVFWLFIAAAASATLVLGPQFDAVPWPKSLLGYLIRNSTFSRSSSSESAESQLRSYPYYGGKICFQKHQSTLGPRNLGNYSGQRVNVIESSFRNNYLISRAQQVCSFSSLDF